MPDAHVVAVHSAFDKVEDDFHAALDTSLEPRGPESLFDFVANLRLAPGGKVVDVGCGRGEQAVELARRFGLEVLGVDPVDRQEATRAEVASRPLPQGSVSFRIGVAESLPVDAASIDFVFCRESIMYADLGLAASEFSRVLRPGGRGLVYLVLRGPLMSDTEAEHFAALMHGKNVVPNEIEDALGNAGFVVDERVDYGGEWAELRQEGEGVPGRRLLFASRLLRQPDRYIDQFGQENYDIMLGDCLWHVYRMLGKLTGMAWVFTKP